MDEVTSFFDVANEAPFVQLPAPMSAERAHHEEMEKRSCGARPKLGTQYADDIKLEEALNDEEEEEDGEEEEEVVDEDELRSQSGFVFSKYDMRHTEASELPIESIKEEIMESVRTRQVSIVEAPTGCGKTTLIPQWILREAYETRSHCNIVVTQPRRIAAVSVAKRVAYQHNCQPGELIGYQIGLEKKTSSDTRLQYVTTGVLLQQLISMRSLKHYTHIVLDEVHEREKNMDFLLIIIRKLLRTNSKRVKLVIMSATFNVDKYANYFATNTYYGSETVPIISLPNVKNYPVDIFYMENLNKILQTPPVDFTNPCITEDMYELTVKLLNAFEKIDAIEEASRAPHDQRPCVLIFLPGLGEIEELYNILQSDIRRNKIQPNSPLAKWWCVPLHSTITTEEQIKAFQTPPTGYRKIILATNIAESSITVTDVKYVIDFCLNKLDMCSQQTNFNSLKLYWASKTNCIQRAGRVGRVRSGKVYRLITSNLFENLSNECPPEMQRSNLENLVLQAKLINMGTPKYLLGLAIDPPDLSNIHKTILVLKEIGAMFKTVSDKYSKEDGDITYMGIIMGKLPLDVRVSKLILLGHIFGCLNECIIIGAALTTRNLFCTPFLEKMSAFNSKLAWANGSASDCITYLNVYSVYLVFKKNHAQLKTWARSMYLQIRSLRELDKLVMEIRTRLVQEKIIDKDNICPPVWTEIELPLVLKIVLAGAFYPNYFCFSNAVENDGREATKILNGRDPYNTVYLTNMDNSQPGVLYASQLKKYFDKCSNKEPHIDFDPNGGKVFVTFPTSQQCMKKESIPGKVALPVYKAIKIRHLRLSIELKVMPVKDSLRLAHELGISTSIGPDLRNSPANAFNNVHLNSLTRLPGIDESYIWLIITSFINCGRFWARIDDPSTRDELEWITNTLNQKGNLTQLKERPEIGGVYAVSYKMTPDVPFSFYRARVEKINGNSAHVFLLDYGTETIVDLIRIYITNENCHNVLETKPIAFECVLSEIGPSLSKNGHGVWTEAAYKRFRELTYGKKLCGKIFSVVFSVVSLELLDNNTNINDVLLSEGHAQISEESYASKMNRDLRDRVEEMRPAEVAIHNNQQVLQNLNRLSHKVAPSIDKCTQKIYLKGPFSPLETKVHTLFQTSMYKSVNINWESVNSVILNTDFNCPNECLLVASIVGETASGNSYNLRNTTLMPNIPGLGAIIALLFSPVAELRCDPYQSCYVSALCGLGHEDGEAIFPEHDIVMNINVELTNSDIQNINSLRHLISQILIVVDDEPLPVLQNIINNKLPQTIKRILNELLSIHRKQHNFSSEIDDWKWNIIRPSVQTRLENDFRENDLYPAHLGLRLNPSNRDLLIKLAKSNQKLRKICQSSTIQESDCNAMQCDLCGTGSLNIQSLRLHLHSRLHREREKDLPRL